MFKEENKPPFLKIRSFLMNKFGENCIELWPRVIVIKKKFFIFSIFFLVKRKLLSNIMYWTTSIKFFKVVIN